VSNNDATCPGEWLDLLASCLQDAFDRPVSLNTPFRGGYIIRTHAAELPWVQLELSRAAFLSHREKHLRVRAALQEWCRRCPS
jgi:hypothetical protein